MTRAYYNEIEPFAAAWLRNLIAAGHIADGDVDERDIRDVRPSDLAGYTQCHFFAGVGVWSYALRAAGWPDDRPVWTGSCPCQPFSAAGGRGGFADERHLWPHWHHLVRVCRPGVVFGEQVASKDGLGWIDLVQTDMEGEAYAFGPVDICAAGVGAPHIRQRLFWLAYAASGGLHGRGPSEALPPAGPVKEPERLCNARELGDTGGARGCDHARPGDGPAPGPVNGFWRVADWIFCRDNKWRPVEPGASPLAHGATSRVGRLRAYGNAINAEVATEFVTAAGYAIDRMVAPEW
jgi:DNA (cytosine-5)-methyltransferase 1